MRCAISPKPKIVPYFVVSNVIGRTNGIHFYRYRINYTFVTQLSTDLVDLSFSQIYVLAIVALLILSLYREWLNPSLTFFLSAVALLLGGIITPSELLKGLSNQQIILIFLLVLVTAGIRLIYGSELFVKLFNPGLSA